MYGISYVEEFEGFFVQIFNKGIENPGHKMRPGKMYEEKDGKTRKRLVYQPNMQLEGRYLKWSRSQRR